MEIDAGVGQFWTPITPKSGSLLHADSQSIGHGSGKSLLCRMIRYCLGEDRFAPEEQRNSIALAFPKGTVGAEVIVDGTVWAILRPIGMERKHYAVPNANIEDIVKGKVEPTGIEPFLEAVESRIVSANVAALIPGEKAFRGWLVALAWLARDQECHLEKIHEWRSSDSQSRSPVRSFSYQQTLEALRALIGAITPEECRIRGEIILLEAKHKESGQEIGHRRWETRKTKNKLITELGLRREDLPAGSLGLDVLRNTAKEQLVKAARIDTSSDAVDLVKLRADSEEANKRAESLSTDLAVIDAQIPEIERLLIAIKGELPGLSFAVHKAENPQCPICEVPIDRALAEGCKLSHKLPNLEEVNTRWDKLKQEIKDEEDRFQNLKIRRASIEDELPGARRCAEEIKAQIQSIEQAREARNDAWYVARRLIDDVNRFDGLLGELEQKQSTAFKLYEKIKEKKEETTAFRQLQANIFNHLSHFFDAIIRRVAGSEAEGKVKLDGKGLHLSVKMGGERSTPALNSLKVIAFDLAVLCMSIEDRTHIPPFLIHDSPREADLGLSIYHQLFYFVKELEQIGDQPLFQYIVTTTTRPPEELLEEPWLRATLRGSPSDERLMRRDL